MTGEPMTNDLCPHCQLPRQGAHDCFHSMRGEIERLTQERDEYKAWWERDSKNLGTALNDLSLERACKQDLQAQVKWQSKEIDAQVREIQRLRGHEPSADVTRLPVPGSKMTRLSDIADSLVRELQRQGMSTMQAVFDGMKVRVEPWQDPQENPKCTFLGGCQYEPKCIRACAGPPAF